MFYMRYSLLCLHRRLVGIKASRSTFKTFSSSNIKTAQPPQCRHCSNSRIDVICPIKRCIDLIHCQGYANRANCSLSSRAKYSMSRLVSSHLICDLLTERRSTILYLCGCLTLVSNSTYVPHPESSPLFLVILLWGLGATLADDR